MKQIFEPCRKRDHATCTRAYFDQDGEAVRCGCSCHVQAGLFGDSKPSIQPDLFQTSKDAGKGLKLSQIGSNRLQGALL